MSQRASRNHRERPLWSDGIHFVRAAGPRDRHKMRWVVAAHTITTSPLKRHVETAERGIEIAADATKRWLDAHPEDVIHLPVEAPPSDSQPDRKIVLPPFVTTLFDCVYANPIAQVWLMTKTPGEVAPVGRRRAGGRAPDQTPVPHVKGECAVLCGQEPVRDRTGDLRVFPHRAAAEDHAYQLYRTAPEDERLRWTDGHVVVAAIPGVEVHFNPEVNGVRKPFSLWLPEYSKSVKVDSTVPVPRPTGTAMAKLASASPEYRALVEAARSRARSEDRRDALEDRDLCFRSIWGALEEADRRAAMLPANRLNRF